jgi:hypothetical protein
MTDSKTTNIVIADGKDWRWLCPWCNEEIVCRKRAVKCKIFRHGVYWSDETPIDPHTSQEDCRRLLREGLIAGCAKPFRFVYNRKGNYVERCGYI